MIEHETIWLQPWCDKCEKSCAGAEIGRLWCQDNAWDHCDECKREPVEYKIVKKKQREHK